MSKKMVVNWTIRLGSVAAVAILAGNLATHNASADTSTSNYMANQDSNVNLQSNSFGMQDSDNQSSDSINSNDQSNGLSNDPSNFDNGQTDNSSNDTNGGFFSQGRSYHAHTRSRAS